MHNVQLHKGSLAPEEQYPPQDVADIRHPSLIMPKPDSSSCAVCLFPNSFQKMSSCIVSKVLDCVHCRATGWTVTRSMWRCLRMRGGPVTRGGALPSCAATRMMLTGQPHICTYARTYLHSAPLLLIYPASKQDQHLHLASYLSDTTKHTKLQRHCASFAIWDP